VDGVQRIYRINGVNIEDKHLELVVRPIAFAQVIQDSSSERQLVQGEDQSLDILERVNWDRALINWQKKIVSREWESKVYYRPSLFGLTKSVLRNTSFLSAASFQETSRVLARASFRSQVDYLLGLKENLILGTLLPIGTNSRSLISDIFSVNSFSDKSQKTKVQNLTTRKKDIVQRKTSLLWIDTIYYLEIGLLIFEKKLFLKLEIKNFFPLF
jgi:hypothetical protein